ncbi:carboxypeptidase regulatory-like domain-containing protein [Corallococcus praedator]|uniref:Carboxypeptidase regulatory-like domain-containing protein n=1 Tax=Corallococcus praedator TaxID=2316724 RepID=A0ABX9Q6V1_9BACT|nr:MULTISPECIES: carboxypeptidase-like regulatory domain-containing protein [Corallococcus]RKG99973.1 carboxypeptidase regulatory-like domain-containing protein [Corallococcus sp. CA047B]RKH22046.1 carboxypeptidase regulatory-like domain-containing protein [Corallococcus sp. CA031C]RKH92798.1 carboxypeptidase regulatory-like domain-containing protein [Corallococcus praedator]
MRHASLTFLGLGLLALTHAGCERYPEDPIFAYGRMRQLDGAPLAGAPLTLERRRDGVFSPVSTTTTEASGDFIFELLSGDAVNWRSLDEQQSRLRLATPLDATGRGMFALLYMEDDVEFPTLQPWDAHPRVDVGPQGPSVAFPPPPPLLEVPETASLPQVLGPDDNTPFFVPPTPPEPLVWLTSEGLLVWRHTGTTSPWTPSPHLLEDFASPQVQLRAVSVGSWYFSPLGGEPSGLDFRVEWRTAHEPLPPGTLRPVSRGATCEPTFPQACPWTDGRLEPVLLADPKTDPRVYSLVVTLPQPTRPRHAVVRGLSHAHGYQGKEWLILEGSLDGEHWHPLNRTVLRDEDSRARITNAFTYSHYADLSGQDSPYGDSPILLGNDAPVFIELPLADAEPTRYVRLSVELLAYGGDTSPGALFSLAELSVFE